MEIKLNESLLEKKLEELERARTWSAGVISKLESFIRTQDDFQLFRVNPLRFAIDKAITENEAVDLFLYAAKGGLFRMNWELMCRHCGSPVKSFAELKTLHTEYYCAVCQFASEAALDDLIQVNFTVALPVRELVFHHPETLSIEDYAYKYSYHRGAYVSEGGPSFSEVMASLERARTYLEPGERKEFEIELSAGGLHLEEFVQKVGVRLPIAPGGGDQLQHATATLRNGVIETEVSALTSGRLLMTFENGEAQERAAFFAYLVPSGVVSSPVVFDPFLTGRRLLSTQTFRDLFRSEVIEGTKGISVKDLTILFTDLKGSTALYGRIGDLNAFALVRQHFESLGTVIKAHNGAIVKTIGDAVMATFLDPVDSVKAALALLEEIEALNRELGSAEVMLKVGIHKGSLIAVTLNDRLDYFGQTVNIAARVQGLADAEEIYLTNAVYEQPKVKDLLAGYEVVAGETRLRGIEQAVSVHMIRRLYCVLRPG